MSRRRLQDPDALAALARGGQDDTAGPDPDIGPLGFGFDTDPAPRATPRTEPPGRTPADVSTTPLGDTTAHEHHESDTTSEPDTTAAPPTARDVTQDEPEQDTDLPGDQGHPTDTANLAGRDTARPGQIEPQRFPRTTEPRPATTRTGSYRQRLADIQRRTADRHTSHDRTRIPISEDPDTFASYLAAVDGEEPVRSGGKLPVTIHHMWSAAVTARQRLVAHTPNTTVPGRTRGNTNVAFALTLQVLHTVATTDRDTFNTFVTDLAAANLFDRTAERLSFVPWNLPVSAREVYDDLMAAHRDAGMLAHGWQLQLAMWTYTLPVPPPPGSQASTAASRLDALLAGR